MTKGHCLEEKMTLFGRKNDKSASFGRKMTKERWQKNDHISNDNRKCIGRKMMKEACVTNLCHLVGY